MAGRPTARSGSIPSIILSRDQDLPLHQHERDRPLLARKSRVSRTQRPDLPVLASGLGTPWATVLNISPARRLRWNAIRVKTEARRNHLVALLFRIIPGLLPVALALTAATVFAMPADEAIHPVIQRQGLSANIPPATGVSFASEVKPILDNRCVVCHGCYDAPCQLKLESSLALRRGASKDVIFDGTRLKSMSPTRMNIDARNTLEWRRKGFYTVLNEGETPSSANLGQSVLVRMLLLKQDHPLPVSGALGEEFDFGLNRPLECSRPEEFDRYAREHPRWGMPYGLPGLTPDQHRTLLAWIEQGAKGTEPDVLPDSTLTAVERWEAFINGASLKERLTARYVYEHLFMGHLHFKGHGPGEFFRLVRSSTPPGQPVREIPATRPYDDPGGRFYYRLRLLSETFVDKNHAVYEIGDERLARLRELFILPEFEVKALPGYQTELAANPFLSFKALPAESRYRFMLDDAYYFISGFMKGPVCRGQVALNVIRDQFWVMFYDPDTDRLSQDDAFLGSEANWLRLPSEQGDSVELDDLVISYTRDQTRYLKAKNAFLEGLPDTSRNSLAAIWQGNGTNPNAAMTAFRHFDSASLMPGFVGAPPQTAWLIDYPLFERIHYLLVAGFNVFGSVTHQAATRLYMDNLRMEAENNFLSLLPASLRPSVYRDWNRGLLTELNSALVNPFYGYGKDSAVTFQTGKPLNELFHLAEARLGPLAGPATTLYRCRRAPCEREGATPLEHRAERLLRPLTFLTGGGIHWLPELSFLRVHERHSPADQGIVYSLVQNKMLANVSFMFWESARRLPEEDTLTVVPGFAGAYPNFFFDVAIDELEAFVSQVLALGDAADALRLVERWGIRRTNPDFWVYADFMNRLHRNNDPVTAGLFDLSRYENR